MHLGRNPRQNRKDSISFVIHPLPSIFYRLASLLGLATGFIYHCSDHQFFSVNYTFFIRPPFKRINFLIYFFFTWTTSTNIMRIFSLAALAISAYGASSQTVLLDENVPCSDFAEVFGSFTGMKTKCRGKSNKKKTKQFCNLICENGQQNVWSTKPIKVWDIIHILKRDLNAIYFNSAKQRKADQTLAHTTGDQIRSRMPESFATQRKNVHNLRQCTMSQTSF